jgi:tRNA modification GTPase
MSDTIFALASARGRAGIAVFRISGPEAGPTLTTLCRIGLPAPRAAARVFVRDRTGEVVDDGLALWFPAPASFTGEDVAELHLHGGAAVARAMTDALVALGLRPAEPGEFSRRAFLAGKIDLTHAEGVADLIDAETAAQRRQARRQIDGGLLGRIEGWRDRLVRARAHLEAEIDFAEDGLPEQLGRDARTALADLAAEMRASLAESGRGERVRDGFDIAVVGAPNVGKSSLLNRIAGRDAAIVASMAGTTRDVIEVQLDLGGYPVTLADTAGLRALDEEGAAADIEREGMRRTRARARSADLRLVVLDGSAAAGADAESAAMRDLGPSLVVVNKADLLTQPPEAERMPVSALTGAGIEALVNRLETLAIAAMATGDGAVLTRARHRAAVTEAVAAIGRALDTTLPELAAEDVRVATDALGRITGRVDVEDLLDVIFREFCIGK